MELNLFGKPLLERLQALGAGFAQPLIGQPDNSLVRGNCLLRPISKADAPSIILKDNLSIFTYNCSVLITP